jgi:dihydroflavonol-4-reductase
MFRRLEYHFFSSNLYSFDIGLVEDSDWLIERFRLMNTLVTGGNGFIGSTLVEKLLQKGHQVTCLVRKSSNLEWLQNRPVTLRTADLMSGQGLDHVFSGIDWVFHLAGVTKAKKRQGYFDGNVTVTKQILQACSDHADLEKFVYVSSQAAAGPSLAGIPLTERDEPHPISIYGECKLRAEKEVLSYRDRFPVTVVRPPSVYGPRDRDVFVYFQNVKKGVLLVLGKGTQRISIVHVADLVDGILLAADKPESNGQVYFISGDGEYDWQTIGHYIAQAMRKKTVTIRVPLSVLHGLSRISIAFSHLTAGPALLNQDKVREMVQPFWLCSNQLAKQELGFQPKISLEQGVAQTAKWYKENQWL